MLRQQQHGLLQTMCVCVSSFQPRTPPHPPHTPSCPPPHTSILLQQDFPYYFEPDVTHWLLWNSSPLDSQAIQGHIAEKFPAEQWEHLTFVNPAALQSILSVSEFFCWVLGFVCVFNISI